MDTPDIKDSLKFNIAFSPYANTPMRGEWLWGRWLDRRQGLVLAANNAFQVPLVVNDVLRVERDSAGLWRTTELVRVTESVVSFTCWQSPVTTEMALATYDRWRAEGHAIHTEGNQEMMTTAWSEFLTFEDVMAAAGPDLVLPGWQLWGLYRPHERRADIEQALQFRRGRRTPTGSRRRR